MLKKQTTGKIPNGINFENYPNVYMGGITNWQQVGGNDLAIERFIGMFESRRVLDLWRGKRAIRRQVKSQHLFKEVAY